MAAPFFTRRSTLGFSAACVAGGFVWQGLIGGDLSGATGLILAGAVGFTLVTGAVAWVAAIILALRANSMVWLLVALLPLVPINSVVCAMFCPASPAAKKP